MPIELQGTLHFIGDTQTFGQNFQKRPFILRVPNPKDSKWDSYIPMAFTRDKVDLLDRYRENDEVIVGVDIKGRLAKDDDRKAYADIEAWKIYYPEQNHQKGSSSRETSSRDDRPRRQPDRNFERPQQREQVSDRERRYRDGGDEDEIPF